MDSEVFVIYLYYIGYNKKMWKRPLFSILYDDVYPLTSNCKKFRLPEDSGMNRYITSV